MEEAAAEEEDGLKKNVSKFFVWIPETGPVYFTSISSDNRQIQPVHAMRYFELTHSPLTFMDMVNVSGPF